MKMLELTEKNHFCFGYNGIPFANRQGRDDKWFVRYGQCQRAPHSFADECVATARAIAHSAGMLPIWVLFSGGIDSEVVARSFLKAGIDFKIAILRFSEDLNIHDISYAVIVCENLGIPYKFFDLDPNSFFPSDLARMYARETGSITYQLLPTMWLMDQVPGYPILGSGDCYLVNRSQMSLVANSYKYKFSDDLPVSNAAPEWDLWEKEKIAAWYRFLQFRQKPGCGGFFQYTPEIMASYLLDPIVQNFIFSSGAIKVSTQDCKLKMYQSHFPILARPKYNGYEKMLEIDRLHRHTFESAYADYNHVFRTPYHDLMKVLLPKWREFSGIDKLFQSY